jgi:hypothetical protein
MVVEDFAQVSEDKLAVMFSTRVCIFNIDDGRLLLSKDLKGVRSPQETMSSEEIYNYICKRKIIILL